MVTMTQGHVISRPMLWLVAGLLALSAILFVVGVAVERGTEAHEPQAIHQEAVSPKPVDADGGEGGESTGEGHSETSTIAQTTPEQSESVAGIDLENPWFVGLAAVVSLALVGALFRFGYRVLPVILIFAIGAALFDIAEVVRQVQRNNMTITLLAGLVLAAHAAVALVSLLNLAKSRVAAKTAGAG